MIDAIINKRKYRRWLYANVFRVACFRNAFEAKKRATDSKEILKFSRKCIQLDRKIGWLSANGLRFAGLSPDEIKKINLAIIEQLKQGQQPATIFKQLLQQNLK